MTVRANSWLQRVGVEESALGGCRGGPAVCPGWGLEGRGEGGVLHCPLGGMLESTTSSPDWVERECGNIRIWSRHGDGKNAGAGRGRGSPRVCGEEGMHCIKAVTLFPDDNGGRAKQALGNQRFLLVYALPKLCLPQALQPGEGDWAHVYFTPKFLTQEEGATRPVPIDHVRWVFATDGARNPDHLFILSIPVLLDLGAFI